MTSKSKGRTLILSEQVNQKSVSDLIKSIYNFNQYDREQASEYKKYKREPINIILNTYGGSVYDGLGLIGAIEMSKTPVHITCLGSAMSMGLFILVSGHKRFIHKHSTVMYHQISTLNWDKLEGIKQNVKEAERLEKVCESILFKYSKVNKDHIKDYKKRKAEWFISPEEALKLKIVDKVL